MTHPETAPLDQQTIAAYEDPSLVSGYIAANAARPSLNEHLRAFAVSLPGNRVLDLGCGPGQDAWTLTSLGLEVTGLDLSAEMIRRAESLGHAACPPRFVRADMRALPELFSPASFDGVWAVASLLHLPRDTVPLVLRGIRHVVVRNGLVYLTLKEGSGEEAKRETVYGKPATRRFVYWTESALYAALSETGFQVLDSRRDVTPRATWLSFLVRPLQSEGGARS